MSTHTQAQYWKNSLKKYRSRNFQCISCAKAIYVPIQKERFMFSFIYDYTMHTYEWNNWFFFCSSVLNSIFIVILNALYPFAEHENFDRTYNADRLNLFHICAICLEQWKKNCTQKWYFSVIVNAFNNATFMNLHFLFLELLGFLCFSGFSILSPSLMLL